MKKANRYLVIFILATLLTTLFGCHREDFVLWKPLEEIQSIEIVETPTTTPQGYYHSLDNWVTVCEIPEEMYSQFLSEIFSLPHSFSSLKMPDLSGAFVKIMFLDGSCQWIAAQSEGHVRAGGDKLYVGWTRFDCSGEAFTALMERYIAELVKGDGSF